MIDKDFHFSDSGCLGCLVTIFAILGLIVVSYLIILVLCHLVIA